MAFHNLTEMPKNLYYSFRWYFLSWYGLTKDFGPLLWTAVIDKRPQSEFVITQKEWLKRQENKGSWSQNERNKQKKH